MFELSPVPGSSKSLVTLSRLLLPPETGHPSTADASLGAELASMEREEFDAMVALAHSNHVVVRALEITLGVLREARDEMRTDWGAVALTSERARIHAALPYLEDICAAFHSQAQDIIVIKSLDHWPDLGSDLDLYTDADPRTVIQLMQSRFQAQLAPRSWGDRLACKWNFLIPGLAESVEIHMGRLGQTGEQTVLARRIAGRARAVRIENRTFRVPAVSDRLAISTLQRMYRHFYFRLCDVVDTAEIADSGWIDYEELRSSARASGIWEGVATYLVIVSDYVRRYRGRGLDLPAFVTEAARFGGNEIYFARDFLRVPILPQSARLYGTQMAGYLRKRQWHSGARLGLLPWLATAAALEQKLTGSDKGIW